MHEIDRLTLDKEALARVADTKPLHNKIEELERELKSYESIHENDKHGRQLLTDNLTKRDDQIDELERINHDIRTELDHKDQIIMRKQQEIDELKYKLQDSDTQNNGLHNDLKDQTEKIIELEADLAQ